MIVNHGRLKVFAEWRKDAPQYTRHARAVRNKAGVDFNMPDQIRIVEKISIEPDRILKQTIYQRPEWRLI